MTRFCFFSLWDGNGEWDINIHSNSPLACLLVLQTPESIPLQQEFWNQDPPTRCNRMRSGRWKGGASNHPAILLCCCKVEFGRGRDWHCTVPVTSFVRPLWWALESHRSREASDSPHLPGQAVAKISGQFSSIVLGVTPSGSTLGSQL